jgi:hypothetical protein
MTLLKSVNQQGGHEEESFQHRADHRVDQNWPTPAWLCRSSHTAARLQPSRLLRLVGKCGGMK